MREGIVIGVFGAELRILDSEGRLSAYRLGGAGEIARAMDEALPKAKRARIVWQPDSLEVREVAAGESDHGPSGDFLAETGADTAGAVWSFEPGDRGSGFLHLERPSELPEIAGALARRGIRVEGAWPLVSLLEAGAPDGRGRLSLVATSSRAYVFCGSPGGSRFLQTCAASDRAALRGAVRDAIARFDEADPPEGWLAAEDGPAEAAAREIASAHSLKEIPFGEFLRRAARLQPGGPGDFLRRPALSFRRKRLAAAAAAAGIALLSVVAIHALSASRLRRQRALLDERQRAEERLEEAESLSLKHRLDALQKDIGRIRSPRQRAYELLLAMARAAPENVRLTSLSIENGSFTASGLANGPAAGDPWAEYLRDLAPPGAPWQLRDPRLSPDRSAAVICGSFREDAGNPAAPGMAPPREAARLERDFESARSRLPTAEAFDEKLRELGRTWNIRAGPVERFDGIEARGYALSWTRPRLEAWPDILATVQALCEQPGLTIQRLDLAVEPGADAFSKAEVDLLLVVLSP
jgi:hypothetical protein